jgi:hypothetical protein
MDEQFEKLKAELEDERIQLYIERFGALPGMKDPKPAKKFN